MRDFIQNANEMRGQNLGDRPGSHKGVGTICAKACRGAKLSVGLGAVTTPWAGLSTGTAYSEGHGEYLLREVHVASVRGLFLRAGIGPLLQTSQQPLLTCQETGSAKEETNLSHAATWSAVQGPTRLGCHQLSQPPISGDSVSTHAPSGLGA